MKKLYPLFLLLIVFQLTQAQVLIATTGSAYTQNFSTLATTGTNNAWTDNATITGWYANRTFYISDNGSNGAGALYSFGATSSSDRALGAVTSGSVATVQFGVQVKNTTGSPVTSFALAYTGEEWRQNTAAAQKLVFEYSTDATTLTNGTWTPVTAFDFTAPVTGTAGPLDGNVAANRTAISGTVSATVANNATVWFRWTKIGSSSPGLAIDDVSITTNGGVVSSITTGAVSTPPFCIDAATAATGTVAYTASGTYNTTFTAYLSDAAGNFGTPVSVGTATVNGTNPSGTINITLPAGTASGTGYKIRIDATSPAVTGTVGTAFEIVAGVRNVTGATASAGNAQATVSWTNPASCFDEILIVAKASASVTATPSGNGSGYTASPAFGSGTPFDGGYVVYKGTGTSQTVTGLTNGTLYYFKIFTRRGTSWSAGVEVSATPGAQPGPGDILINQLSPDYDGPDDEYIELINKTNSNIDLSGFAIRYQAANGNPGTAGGTLSGTLLARRYWLLSPNLNVTVGQTTNLSRNGFIMAGMGASAGQVALVRLSDGIIIDAVGYGGAGALTGGTYTETAAAPAPPADGGLKRSPDATDNNNNATDFVTVANGAILLRNSAAGSPLPVKFANLKAVQKGAAVYVSWSNITESDIKEYVVERSVNGVDFSPLVKTTPTGNRQAQADYVAVDASPAIGANYYRIRSTEMAGKTTFSNLLKLSTAGATASLLVYPNPLKGGEGMLQLSNLPAGQYTVRVIGADGRVLQSKMMKFTEGSGTEPFSVNHLPSGIYTLQVTGSLNFRQYFIKQ